MPTLSQHFRYGRIPMEIIILLEVLTLIAKIIIAGS
jgi:hypothetical protein